MSLDATHTNLSRYGKIVIEGGEVTVIGFEGEQASCRDIAVLACAYGIGVLQEQMMRTIEQPGGGRICIDSDDEEDGMPEPGEPWTEEQMASLRAWAKTSDEESTLRRAEEIKAERALQETSHG